jgi:transglutaminase-like putative cysteine protease
MQWVHQSIRYTPGATDVHSDVGQVLKKGDGVCQDLAHVMIGVCRMAGIPARYVSGYIETDSAPEEALVGATASHAWLEVLSPNGFWVGIDPTNNQFEGVRHVQIGVGRDYADVPPLKGVFKGPDRQALTVAVRMTRNELTPATSKANARAVEELGHATEHRAYHYVSLRPTGTVWRSSVDGSRHRRS